MSDEKRVQRESLGLVPPQQPLPLFSGGNIKRTFSSLKEIKTFHILKVHNADKDKVREGTGKRRRSKVVEKYEEGGEMERQKKMKAITMYAICRPKS